MPRISRWITRGVDYFVRKIADNRVEITANVDTYVDGQPRSSYHGQGE
ncbi:MAG: hypothetical protein ACLUDU_17120 [Butyricimonas faecihominis]